MRGVVGIGREWIWTSGCLGFAVSYAALLGLEYSQSNVLLYSMVFAQGFFGYALTSVMGPIVAETGPRYGSIFGTITIGLIGGGAAPGSASVRRSVTGSYEPAFLLIMAFASRPSWPDCGAANRSPRGSGRSEAVTRAICSP